MSATLEEHVGYISDAVRMEQFRQAIAQAIRPGDVVVDLGCGFAPLGLMCLQAGAARVYGIDSTEAIEIARESAARAGFADRYHCISNSSFRTELPELADVVICDHVGYFGFDYGVIQIIGDARRRMLKPGGKVLPQRLSLRMAGINSAACRDKAFAWTASAMPEAYRWLEDYCLNTKHTHCYAANEVLTNESTIGDIDLGIDQPDHLQFAGELIALSDGEMDGLGGWFDCTISGQVHMTNSPLDPGRIRRDQVFLPFARPLPVNKGDSVAVTLGFRHDNSLIAWTAHNRASNQKRRHTTWASMILSEADRHGAAEAPARLGNLGAASRALLSLIDGKRTTREIADQFVSLHPDLFPGEAEIRKWIQGELARYTR